MRIGVLVSGAGSNLEAILSAGLPVAVVVADRECAARAIADAHGLPFEVVAWEKGADRVEFTHRVVDALERHGVELVAMAGFMRILEKPIFDAYPGKVTDTHPSLLPSFRGAHAIADALAAGVKVTGCTIHVAIPDVDAGPILAQEAVPVLDDDTEESLHERVKQAEHRLYPEVLKRMVASS
jgi:phosphoribosylglycinamide formyltransferase-1